MPTISHPLSSPNSAADPFAAALDFVMLIEGGLSDDPDDAGGLTKYGISQTAYPGEDIRAMTHERAAFLYRRDYWDAMRLDRLPARLAMVVFDAAVNCGVSAAGKQLQQAVNALGAEPPLVVDGIPGPMSAAAVQRLDSMGMLPSLISNLFLARVAHYSNLCERKPNQRAFLRGWIRRVVALRQAVGAML